MLCVLDFKPRVSQHLHMIQAAMCVGCVCVGVCESPGTESKSASTEDYKQPTGDYKQQKGI